jgi:urease accessory protein
MLRLDEVVREPTGLANSAKGADGADGAGVAAGARSAGALTLSFDERRRSRLLATLDDGREVALMLPRGTILRHGDRLRGDGGLVVEVRAAAEGLSIAATRDAHLLTRAAYHLGNRHVPLEIGADWLAYAHDHVLDDMVRGLGLDVSPRVAPFEPEAGAFAHEAAGGGHSHRQHDHDHDHGRTQNGDGDGDGPARA